MKILSMFLDVTAKNGIFRYHPKCKRVELTHLCFANDLLIFSKGDIDYIIGVQKVWEFFYEISGLKLNPAKSEFFLASVSEG